MIVMRKFVLKRSSKHFGFYPDQFLQLLARPVPPRLHQNGNQGDGECELTLNQSGSEGIDGDSDSLISPDSRKLADCIMPGRRVISYGIPQTFHCLPAHTRCNINACINGLIGVAHRDSARPPRLLRGLWPPRRSRIESSLQGRPEQGRRGQEVAPDGGPSPPRHRAGGDCPAASSASRSTRTTAASTSSPSPPAACGRPTTPAPPGRRSSTTRARTPSAASRSTRRTRTSSGSAPARTTASAASATATASTSPTDGGKTWTNVGLKTVRAHRQDPHRPARLGHGLRRRAGAALGAGRRPRPVQDHRRRQDLEQGPQHQREHRRHRRRAWTRATRTC